MSSETSPNRRLIRTALAQRLGQLGERVVGGVEHHRFLGGEVVVDRLLRDPDPRGHLRDRDVVEAARGEHRRGGVGDRLPRQPPLALTQPLVRVLAPVARLLSGAGTAHRRGDFLAHLLDDQTVEDFVAMGFGEQFVAGLVPGVNRADFAVHR
jgi:hypothetical protein